MRKPSRKTLTNKLDFTWSRLIRSKGFCERCGRTNCKLDAAHIVGRQNRRLRWDVRNGWCACFLCHRWNHDHPLEFAAWILEHRPDDVDYLLRVKNDVTNYSTADYIEKLAALEASLELEAA